MGTPVERATATYASDDDKYSLANKMHGQYFQLYYDRLMTLAPRVDEARRDAWGDVPRRGVFSDNGGGEREPRARVSRSALDVADGASRRLFGARLGGGDVVEKDVHVCFEAKRGDEIAPTRRGVRGERQGFFVGIDRRRRRARALGERRLDVFAVRWVVHPRGEVVDVAQKFPKRRGRALADRPLAARRRVRAAGGGAAPYAGAALGVP